MRFVLLTGTFKTYTEASSEGSHYVIMQVYSHHFLVPLAPLVLPGYNTAATSCILTFIHLCTGVFLPSGLTAPTLAVPACLSHKLRWERT